VTGSLREVHPSTAGHVIQERYQRKEVVHACMINRGLWRYAAARPITAPLEWACRLDRLAESQPPYPRRLDGKLSHP
jgi:hypothetical protein